MKDKLLTCHVLDPCAVNETILSCHQAISLYLMNLFCTSSLQRKIFRKFYFLSISTLKFCCMFISRFRSLENWASFLFCDFYDMQSLNHVNYLLKILASNSFSLFYQFTKIRCTCTCFLDDVQKLDILNYKNTKPI